MVSFDLNESEKAESQVDFIGKTSGLSFLPNQIKGFLSKKQLKADEQSKNQFESPSRKQLNSHSYLSPSQASLAVGLNKLYPPINDGNPKPKKDFVPGEGHSVTKAMKQVNNIIASARKLQDKNYGIMQLAGQMQGKIRTDRSPMNLNQQPDMFNNLPYFEQEYRLRKYEIEDLYLRRQALKQQQEQLGLITAKSSKYLTAGAD